jgi:hypothetical protein
MTVHGSTTSERDVRDNDYAGVANVLKALGGRRVHIALLISKLPISATSAHPFVAAPLMGLAPLHHASFVLFFCAVSSITQYAVWRKQ